MRRKSKRQIKATKRVGGDDDDDDDVDCALCNAGSNRAASYTIENKCVVSACMCLSSPPSPFFLLQRLYLNLTWKATKSNWTNWQLQTSTWQNTHTHTQTFAYTCYMYTNWVQGRQKMKPAKRQMKISWIWFLCVFKPQVFHTKNNNNNNNNEKAQAARHEKKCARPQQMAAPSYTCTSVCVCVCERVCVCTCEQHFLCVWQLQHMACNCCCCCCFFFLVDIALSAAIENVKGPADIYNIPMYAL